MTHEKHSCGIPKFHRDRTWGHKCSPHFSKRHRSRLSVSAAGCFPVSPESTVRACVAGLHTKNGQGLRVLPPMCDAEAHTYVQLTHTIHLPSPPTPVTVPRGQALESLCPDLRPCYVTSDKSLNSSVS